MTTCGYLRKQRVSAAHLSVWGIICIVFMYCLILDYIRNIYSILQFYSILEEFRKRYCCSGERCGPLVSCLVI